MVVAIRFRSFWWGWWVWFREEKNTCYKFQEVISILMNLLLSHPDTLLYQLLAFLIPFQYLVRGQTKSTKCFSFHKHMLFTLTFHYDKFMSGKNSSKLCFNIAFWSPICGFSEKKKQKNSKLLQFQQLLKCYVIFIFEAVVKYQITKK